MVCRNNRFRAASRLGRAGRHTEAGLAADIEPGGYTLQIGVTSFAPFVEAVSGYDRLDLGLAAVRLVDEPATAD